VAEGALPFVPCAPPAVSQPQSSSVHRYFPLADSFVEVRQLDPESTLFEAPRGLDRAGYSRFVIQTCMPQFTGELARDLEMLFPEDPATAEELLYGICVEVNPALEIHNVQLRPRAGEPRPQPRPHEEERDPLRQLARVSRDLERQLKQRVHGQDPAVEALCRSVRKAAAGLSAASQPLGCFLLVGRTGTGKTELCRRLAEALASDEEAPGDNLIRIDCSEYALAHEYSKLLGSPPGYIGHEEGGQLTRALAEKPSAVLLFDEIEKAHSRLHNLLLQVIEEGCLTDGRGQRVDLSGHFVLLTSNAGAEDIRSAAGSVGFHRSKALGEQALSELTESALERLFSPEFLGRLDDVLLFRELDEAAARLISQDQLTELALRARRRGARVAFTPAVARWLCERGFSAQFGARELRSVLRREIEPAVAEELLRREPREGALLRVRVQGGELAFRWED